MKKKYEIIPTDINGGIILTKRFRFRLPTEESLVTLSASGAIVSLVIMIVSMILAIMNGDYQQVDSHIVYY